MVEAPRGVEGPVHAAGERGVDGAVLREQPSERELVDREVLLVVRIEELPQGVIGVELAVHAERGDAAHEVRLEQVVGPLVGVRVGGLRVGAGHQPVVLGVERGEDGVLRLALGPELDRERHQVARVVRPEEALRRREEGPLLHPALAPGVPEDLVIRVEEPVRGAHLLDRPARVARLEDPIGGLPEGRAPVFADRPHLHGVHAGEALPPELRVFAPAAHRLARAEDALEDRQVPHRALAARQPPPPQRARQEVHHGPDPVGGELSVELGRGEVGVARQRRAVRREPAKAGGQAEERLVRLHDEALPLEAQGVGPRAAPIVGDELGELVGAGAQGPLIPVGERRLVDGVHGPRGLSPRAWGWSSAGRARSPSTGGARARAASPAAPSRRWIGDRRCPARWASRG